MTDLKKISTYLFFVLFVLIEIVHQISQHSGTNENFDNRILHHSFLFLCFISNLRFFHAKTVFICITMFVSTYDLHGEKEN